jgi:hypothetical protein
MCIRETLLYLISANAEGFIGYREGSIYGLIQTWLRYKPI